MRATTFADISNSVLFPPPFSMLRLKHRNRSTRWHKFLSSKLGFTVIMGSVMGLALIIVLAVLFRGSHAAHAIHIPAADDNHGYKVAVAHFALTDTAHKDPYRPAEHRRVMASLFLPIPNESCSAECEDSYMPRQTARIANEQFVVGGKRDAGVFEDMSYKVCCRSSDMIDASKIPVVVLEPHVDTSRLLYSTMARFISANGAAVVMIDHPGDASVVEFPSSQKRGLDTVYNSGTVPLSNMSPITSWNETVETALATRKCDIDFTLSQINTAALLQRQFPGFRFSSSALNTSTYGIVGHGLGGSVATSLGTASKATVFSINLSGTPPILTSDVQNKPLFFFGREDFRREHDLHWPTTWSHLTGRATEFDLDDSAILDVSDLPKIIELARNQGGNKNAQGKGLSGHAPVQGAHAITCFVENIVKQQFRLDGQRQDLAGCIRTFGGVVPYPGH